MKSCCCYCSSSCDTEIVWLYGSCCSFSLSSFRSQSRHTLFSAPIAAPIAVPIDSPNDAPNDSPSFSDSTGYFSAIVSLLVGPTGLSHGIELSDDVVVFARERTAIHERRLTEKEREKQEEKEREGRRKRVQVGEKFEIGLGCEIASYRLHDTGDESRTDGNGGGDGRGDGDGRKEDGETEKEQHTTQTQTAEARTASHTHAFDQDSDSQSITSLPGRVGLKSGLR